MKLLFCFLLWSAPQDVNEETYNKLIALSVKQALEQAHYARKKIDDKLAPLIFKQFLEWIDPVKGFLLKSEVDELSKLIPIIPREMETGEFQLLNKATEMVNKRVKYLDALRKKFFAGEINFHKDGEIELDPKKRQNFTSLKALEKHWQDLFLKDIISQYLDLKNGDDKSSKKDSAVKNSKVKKTDSALKKEAVDAINKRYERWFSRILKERPAEQKAKFLNAVTAVYDPHSSYMSPYQKEDFNMDISGSLEGIGAILKEDGPHIKVESIVVGGAAWRQKELAVDDIILEASEEKGTPVDLVNMDVTEAVRYIRGKKGTTVKLTVRKQDGTRQTIAIVRDTVNISETYAKSSILSMEDSNLRIGYITLPKFYRDLEGGGRNCTDDVRRELVRLMSEKVDGIILDLRGNGGGVLEDAKGLSGLFLKRGPIVQVRDTEGRVNELSNSVDGIYFGPLVVLVNSGSASASEILAAAIQDYRRGITVGGKSHGKGTVQVIYNLNRNSLYTIFVQDLGGLKLTIQKFYRVTGESTQYKGVDPDIVIPDLLGETIKRESDLEYSLKWDKIKPLKYKPINFKYDIKKLKKLSENRVANDESLQNVIRVNQYVDAISKDTKIPLNIDKIDRIRKEKKKKLEEFKFDQINTKLQVSNFEQSLSETVNIKKGDESMWKEVVAKRKTEWVEQLQKDHELQEAMFIIQDMINQV